MSGGGARAVGATVTDRKEDTLPATGGVAPVVGLQDECPLGAVRDHEAVDDVMELAAVAAALINVAHQLPGLTAVRRVLGGKHNIFFNTIYCLTFISAHPKSWSSFEF